MSTLLTQLWTNDGALPISRERVPIESLALEFRACGLRGEIRVIDEWSGAVVTRLPLDEEPEEGDWHQPFPA